MTRPLRQNIAGAVYHVMSRGIERRPIYFDDVDRERFLKLLGSVVRRHRWECFAYCLMDNHYHLVIRPQLANLSQGMGVLNGGHARLVNTRHDRVGHLFQGRFRDAIIGDSGHLRVVVRYVLRNPVAAELCARPEDWHWSSYRATLADQPRGLVATTPLLGWFGPGSTGREQFAGFMRDAIDPPDAPFPHEVEFPCEPASVSADRLGVEELLALHPASAGIAVAHREYGYSLGEIAAALGRSRATVARALVEYESEAMRTAPTWPRTGGQ